MSDGSSDGTATRVFLVSEVEALAPFDFVTLEPTGNPLRRLELTRAESGKLELRVPGRLPMLPALTIADRSALRDRGFASEDASDQTKPWTREAEDEKELVELAYGVLEGIFGEKPGVTLDIMHGSHRAEHEALQRLAVVREQVERVIRDVMKGEPEQDPDGDYLLPIDDVRVTVAPRALPGGPSVVRIFAVTNVGVPVVPELGLFLARLNFGLMFGRFALDVEHNSIWFDEMLLGDQLNEEALRFAIQVVARTADQWDDRLKQMFGGATFQEALKGKTHETPPPIKPGEAREARGLYL